MCARLEKHDTTHQMSIVSQPVVERQAGKLDYPRANA
jgi:hypothetical protein